MAHDSITTVLSVVAWGTKLTFALYDYSVANASSPAKEDVDRLAKEVNALAQVLRQIGSRLKEDDGSIPSPDAFNTVRQILDQSQDVFKDIEDLLPLGSSSRNSSVNGSPSLSVASISSWQDVSDWNTLCQARAQYLIAHLESLKMTLSVMLQTLYTAKTTIWSEYENTQTAHAAATVEKSQMECLVIEQQLALMRAYRLYDAFRQQVAHAPLLLTQSPQSQALIKRDEYGPSPRELVRYQDQTIARAQPFDNDAKDLENVRVIASPYVDYLLSRWTRNNLIEGQQQVELQSRGPHKREKPRQRNWQAPTYESDSECEQDDRRRPPKLQLTTDDPILMHVNEPRSVSSPKSATLGSTLQPPSGPFSPQSSNSWGPTSGSYFPQNSRNGSRPRGSPGPSPLSSPRPSFSGEDGPQRPQTAFKVDAPTPTQPPPPPTKDPVLWRIRINQWYWDYHDDDLVRSSVHMPPQEAIKQVSKDTEPTTEVFQEHVSREAIRERGYEYTKVMRPRVVDGRTVEELCYCIHGALPWEKVVKLVDLSHRLRNPNAPPRSSRGVFPPARPAFLDRSNTAPVYGNKFKDSRRERDRDRDYERERERNLHRTATTSSTSTTSDEDTLYRTPTSSSRSKSRSRRDSGLDEHDSERARSRSKGRGKGRASGGSGKAQALTKIAAGAGLATLLDGLPEMLSHL